MGLKEKWKQANGKQKRNMALAGVLGLIVVAAIAAAITDSVRGTGIGRTKTDVTQVVTPNQRNLTMEGLASELYAIRQQLQQQQINAKPAGMTTEEQEQKMRQIIAETMAAQNLPTQAASSVGFIPPGELPKDTGNAPLAPGSTPAVSGNDATDAEGEIDDNPYQIHTSNNGSADKSAASEPVSASSTGKNAGADSSNYVPPGSQLSIIAISGINAPTGNAAETGKNSDDSMPVLLRVKGLAKMANGFRTDLSDCLVVGSSYGQLADERVFVRPKTITCIRSDGKAVEAKLSGTLMGEDGKPGWHGRLVSRDGKAIAQMMKVGTLNTLGQMGVAAAAAARIGGKDGSGNSINIGTGGSGGQVALNSAAQGINDIFGRVATIYEKYAQQSFPVIEIQPLRTGEILITEGLTLKYAKDKQ